MNHIKSRMISDSNLRVAYGAASRASAFRTAAQLVKTTDGRMAEKLEDIMRIWARLAAEEIRANVR